MIAELALRFVLGGVIVSLFAVAGELFRPKTFAGLFGAAPSVAIASLALMYWQKGPTDVATAARSMLIGAAALLVYSAACVVITKRKSMPVWVGAGLSWGVWAVTAFALWKGLHVAGLIQ